MENQEVEFEGQLSLAKAIGYLEALLNACRAGRICIQEGEDFVVLNPYNSVDLKVKAEQKEDEEFLSLKLSWIREDLSEEDQMPFKISSVIPAIKVPKRLSDKHEFNRDDEDEIEVKKFNGKKKIK